jgi:Complex I intermediate-associated protein 30 (CIA30)
MRASSIICSTFPFIAAVLFFNIVVAQSGNRVIADFDGEKLETSSGLSPWYYADDQLGGTSDVRGSLIHPGAESSRGALRLSFNLTNDFPAPFAAAWAMVGPEGLATDLSAYRGVRFYGRSKDGTAFTCGVVHFTKMVMRYAVPFEVRSEWTLVELPFDKFQAIGPTGGPMPNAPPIDPKAITSVGFAVAPDRRGPFELDVDRVEAYR